MNNVWILVTKNRQYRVQYVDDINLREVDDRSLYMIFKDSKVTRDVSLALHIANNIATNDQNDVGIKVLYIKKNWDDIRNGE